MPNYLQRRDVLKRIVKSRQNNMRTGNQVQKLGELCEAKIELLKEQVIKARNLQKRSASNAARKEKLRLAEEEYKLQLKEMQALLNHLRKNN